MIRRTIKEHLDKERRLRPQGIKVLSLFFVDVVEKYRKYNAEGSPLKGDYALVFEEEYRRFAKHPDYASLFQEVDLTRTAEEVHGGYFSIDRKKVAGKTVEFLKDTGGDTQADDDTYSLIMRDKEKLLSLDTPLKFIFSHSALREGWDNPNVFQICTLRDIHNERERRQTIGRGLRLCVNQNGERVRGFDVNTLTVTANEGYEQFAENLQQEIEEDTGIRFGVVEQHQFAALTVKKEDGSITPLGFERSKLVWEYLHARGYIDGSGKVQDVLRVALREENVELPVEFAQESTPITAILRKLAGRLEIKNAEDRRTVRPRQAVLHSEEFRQLWDRIKYRTTYRVEFDNERLIGDCIKDLREAPPIPKSRLQWRKADIAIGKAGVEATAKAGDAVVVLEEHDIELPDVLTEVQDRTQLTRRTIQRVPRILRPSERLHAQPTGVHRSGRRNNQSPQAARPRGWHQVSAARRRVLLCSGSSFETEELSGYLKATLVDATKSVYEQVVYDSEPEARFAEDLEKNSAIKLYAKLPGWFKVPTPLGTYNPDWAVLVQTAEGERLYFVVETKAGLYLDDLRDKEKAKIACGRAHFKALEQGEKPARYKLARNVDDVLQDL